MFLIDSAKGQTDRQIDGNTYTQAVFQNASEERTLVTS
jgi:hypothetical protein